MRDSDTLAPFDRGGLDNDDRNSLDTPGVDALSEGRGEAAFSPSIVFCWAFLSAGGRVLGSWDTGDPFDSNANDDPLDATRTSAASERRLTPGDGIGSIARGWLSDD
jgi:hypothetical protein